MPWHHRAYGAVAALVTANALVAPAPRLRVGVAARRAATPVGDVMRCLEREYVSFFAPLEAQFYEPTVTFEDPLSSLAGLDAYRGNVDLLAGRTLLGKLLFRDAAIALHDVSAREGGGVRTRWTLRVAFNALPWRPVARFTGVSDYALGDDGRIAGQVDYWDSTDLRPGGAYASAASPRPLPEKGAHRRTMHRYARSPKGAAVADFADQLFGGSSETPGELPSVRRRRR